MAEDVLQRRCFEEIKDYRKQIKGLFSVKVQVDSL